MIFEVEFKFPLADADTVVAGLLELGAQPAKPISQRDVYFQHPSRNFAETDEAMRIRSEDDENCLTYKGPLVDRRSKTRHEIELPIASGEAGRAKADDMLSHLGFSRVRAVVKRRSPFTLIWEGRQVNCVVDEIDRLGTFFEIETFADEADREAATDSLLRLSQRLSLAKSIRKSYLSMLLEQDGQHASCE